MMILQNRKIYPRMRGILRRNITERNKRILAQVAWNARSRDITEYMKLWRKAQRKFNT